MHFIVLVREGFQCPVGFITCAVDDRTIVQDAGEDHQAQIQVLFLGELAENSLNLVALALESLECGDDDLGDHGLAVFNLKVLDILIEKLGNALALDVRADREHFIREFVDVQIRDGRQDVGCALVLFGRGRGLEFEGIGEDGSEQESCQILRNRNLVLTRYGKPPDAL